MDSKYSIIITVYILKEGKIILQLTNNVQKIYKSGEDYLTTSHIA